MLKTRSGLLITGGKSPAISDGEQLLKPTETASALNVSERTLEKWRYEGGGPPYVRLSRRCVRYRLADLKSYIENRVATSTAAEAAS